MYPEVVKALLEELHEGICGNLMGGRSLVHRALTQGYWWLSIQCDQCQRFAPSIHQPEGLLNPISNPWPFSQRGARYNTTFFQRP